MSEREYTSEVKVCRCDVCKERGLGLMHLCDGTPVLFECRACNPAWFTQVASQQAFNAVATALLEAV